MGTSGRPMVVIDGCPLECANTYLEQHDVTPASPVNLAKFGVAKEYHTDYDGAQADELYDDLLAEVRHVDATA